MNLHFKLINGDKLNISHSFFIMSYDKGTRTNVSDECIKSGYFIIAFNRLSWKMYESKFSRFNKVSTLYVSDNKCFGKLKKLILLFFN